MAFDAAQVPDALGLVSPGGCIVLVESGARTGPLPGIEASSMERVETDDGYTVTLIRSSPAIAGVLGKRANPEAAPTELLGWQRQLGRLMFGYRQLGFRRKQDWARFFGDLRILDAQMKGSSAYYLSQVSGAAGPLDPALHYLTTGAEQRLNPHPEFSTRHYLGSNPDVALAYINPLLHYVRNGRAEGRLAMPAAPSNSAGPTSHAASMLAELSSQSAVDELWSSSTVSDLVAVDWQELSALAPCSLILVSRDAAATRRWVDSLSANVVGNGLDVIIVADHEIPGGHGRWRTVVSGGLTDPEMAGLDAARHEAVIVCSDAVVPLPGALQDLLRHSLRCGGRPVAASVMSRTGMILQASMDRGDCHLRFVPFGHVLASRRFVPNDWPKPAETWPICFAGTKPSIRSTLRLTDTPAPAEQCWRSDALVFLDEDVRSEEDDDGMPERRASGARAPAAGALVSVGMHDWMDALLHDGAAIRLFLLDLVAQFGGVRLHARPGSLPVGEREWLGLFGIAFVDSLDCPFEEGTPELLRIWIGAGKWKAGKGTRPGGSNQAVAVEAVRQTYAHEGFGAALGSAEGDGVTAETHHAAVRVAGYCSRPDAGAAIRDFVQAQPLWRSKGAHILLVGPHAESPVTPGNSDIAICRSSTDWVRSMAWADLALLPVAPVPETVEMGQAIAPVTLRHLINRNGAEQRLSRLLNDVKSFDHASPEIQ